MTNRNVVVRALAFAFCVGFLGSCSRTAHSLEFRAMDKLSSKGGIEISTSSTAAPLIFASSTTNQGNVGIGTTNPGAKLEVSGDIKLSGGSPTYKITNVAAPVATSDCATKSYVDSATAPKKWYRTSTTANGAGASTLCSAGYHMCWSGEWIGRVWDSTQGDSGDTWGTGMWVDGRTNDTSYDCSNWTSASTINGATAYISGGTLTALGWLVISDICNIARPAMCCQD